MSIEQKIKTLLELYHFIKGDTHFCGYNEENASQSLKTAIETMRKYQKIEQVVKAWNDMNSYDSMKQISEVVKDGNVD